MKRNGGVAVVYVGAVVDDLLKDDVTFYDVKSKPLGGWKYSQNYIVKLNDGSQGPHRVVGRANEISGLGSELMQFFKLSHWVLQRNKLRRRVA